ncbi:unnamed protein product [Penicillium viridicatum]
MRVTRGSLPGLPPDTYEIQRVLGSSESYLVNDPRETYLLCDAIIATGGTLQANDLDVWQVVKSKGDIVVGLYQRLELARSETFLIKNRLSGDGLAFLGN